MKTIDQQTFFGGRPPAEPRAAAIRRRTHPWYTPWHDLACLLRLAELHKPLRYLEVGCNRGHVMLEMSRACCELVGVDPGLEGVAAADRNPQQGPEYPPAAEVGQFVAELPQVTIHRCPFASLPDCGFFDAIFIDGDHRFEAVLADSQQARGLLSPGGWIAWHDVGNPATPGVARALAEFHPDVTHVAGTWVAFLLGVRL